MAVVITGIGSYLPEIRVTNEDLADRIDTTDEWIRSHTGIGTRHFAADGKKTSDLAVDAAKQAMEMAGISAEDLDIIVVASASQDYFAFPATACIVQAKLGAKKAAAFDVAAGCTGFIYGLDIAASMLGRYERTKALVIGAETLSRLIDWEDRATCVLFGDGAGAAVIEYQPEETERGILYSWLRAKGEGAEHLVLTQPERTSAYTREGDYSKPSSIYMNGKAVYMFAVKAITDVMEALVEKTGYSLDDFKWIVPHQANLRIVQAAAKRFGLPEERFYLNIEEYANTSAASVPLAMAEMNAKGLLKKGDLIMIMGFGAGLTYGGTVIRW
ncbi:MAG: ketoacyl-ACP synthase III [Spirochaetes bacterium]|nr:ketoacyl-ACP synthase III [Spirochaetota bacterium]MBU0955909.1 ketoacyl-ACP synthase III [Spirochaetota bacterium]